MYRLHDCNMGRACAAMHARARVGSFPHAFTILCSILTQHDLRALRFMIEFRKNKCR
jgi:hypothetical protein